MRRGKSVLAASAFTCAALLSFGWSEQGAVSLSVESAQARIGRPLTPMSVAGVGDDNTGACVRIRRRCSGCWLGSRCDWSHLGSGLVTLWVLWRRSLRKHRLGIQPRLPLAAMAIMARTRPAISGGYANRSYVTGRPTLFPRYYGGYGSGGYGGSYATGYPPITAAVTPTAVTSPDGQRCFHATTAATVVAAMAAVMQLATPITAAVTPTAATSPGGQRCFHATTAVGTDAKRTSRPEVVSYYAGGLVGSGSADLNGQFTCPNRTGQPVDPCERCGCCTSANSAGCRRWSGCGCSSCWDSMRPGAGEWPIRLSLTHV